MCAAPYTIDLSVFADDVHCPVSITNFKLPGTALHNSFVKQTLVVHADFKISIFLALQLGQDDFLLCFLVHGHCHWLLPCPPSNQPSHCSEHLFTACILAFNSSKQALQVRIVAAVVCCFANSAMTCLVALISILMLQGVIAKMPTWVAMRA